MPIYGNCFDFTPFVYNRWTFRIAPRIPRSVMSASKATQPTRQPGSTKIKNAALCYLSPIVVGKCSIIHAIAYADISEGLEHELCFKPSNLSIFRLHFFLVQSIYGYTSELLESFAFWD